MREWLLELCRPNSKLARPYVVAHAGVDWDAATNGHAVALVRGATYPDPGEGPGLDIVLEMVPDRREVVSFEELRGWAFVGRTCERCDGLGAVGEWDAAAENESRAVRCPEGCDAGWARSPGLLVDTPVERRLLYRYLRPFAAGEVFVEAGPVGAKAFSNFDPTRNDVPQILLVRPLDDAWRVYVAPYSPGEHVQVVRENRFDALTYAGRAIEAALAKVAG